LNFLISSLDVVRPKWSMPNYGIAVVPMN